jgi:hypothetical protein
VPRIVNDVAEDPIMGEAARVHSIDALKTFKVYLIKFAEVAGAALGDAESEMRRTLSWLEMEQNTFWQQQVRKRGEAVMKCKEAVRHKKLFKDAGGGRQSVVDEERALAAAQRRLEEAEQKVNAVRSHTRKLQREIQMFKGGIQRFSTSVHADIPRACNRLENMVRSLEQYLNLTISDAFEKTESLGSFSRAPVAGAALTNDLRKLTPTPEVRAAAVQEEMTTVPWAVGPVPPVEQKRLLNLVTMQVAGATVPGDSRLVIGKGTFESVRIYLERVEPTGDGDTGWYLGPATDKAINACFSVRIGDLLAVRPDLKNLLTLQKGALVVIGGAGVEGIFDSQGEDHWAAATAAEAAIAAIQEADISDPAAKPGAQTGGLERT